MGGCDDVGDGVPTLEGLGVGPKDTDTQIIKRPRRTRGRGRFIRRWNHEPDDANRPDQISGSSVDGVHCPETEGSVETDLNAKVEDLPGYIFALDDELLSAMSKLAQKLDAIKSDLGHLEQEAYRRMEDRGATSIPSEDYICELSYRPTYDQLGFIPLKEVFNESDLARCLTPAHTEEVEVPDKWATSTVKSLAAKYGADALRIVDRAKTHDRGKLIFKRRENN